MCVNRQSVFNISITNGEKKRKVDRICQPKFPEKDQHYNHWNKIKTIRNTWQTLDKLWDLKPCSVYFVTI